MFIQQNLFESCQKSFNVLRKYENRAALSNKIFNLLLMRNTKVQNANLDQLHSNTRWQIYISQLIRKSKVHQEFLPRDNRNSIKFQINDLGKGSKIRLIIFAEFSANGGVGGLRQNDDVLTL